MTALLKNRKDNYVNEIYKNVLGLSPLDWKYCDVSNYVNEIYKNVLGLSPLDWKFTSISLIT